MRGHNICFNGEILKIIPKLSLLLLLIWSPDFSLYRAVSQREGEGKKRNDRENASLGIKLFPFRVEHYGIGRQK